MNERGVGRRGKGKNRKRRHHRLDREEDDKEEKRGGRGKRTEEADWKEKSPTPTSDSPD